jgi:hypothetical protein
MRMATILSIVLLSGAVSGCSGGSTAAPAPPATNAPSATAFQNPAQTPTQTPTPTPTAVGQGYAGTSRAKDGDGYTFDVTYSYKPSSITVLTAAEKPGFNSIQVTLTSTISVKNTTPGRDIHFGSGSNGTPHLFIAAAFKQDSPVCKDVVFSDQKYAQSCLVMLSYGELHATLAAGQSTELSPVYAGSDSTGVIGNPGPVEAGVAHVADADVAAVKAALAHPDDFEVIYLGDDASRFIESCPRGVGQPVQQGEAIQVPLFSKSGVCHEPQRAAQPVAG